MYHMIYDSVNCTLNCNQCKDEILLCLNRLNHLKCQVVIFIDRGPISQKQEIGSWYPPGLADTGGFSPEFGLKFPQAIRPLTVTWNTDMSTLYNRNSHTISREIRLCFKQAQNYIRSWCNYNTERESR